MPPWLTTKETLLHPLDDGGDDGDDDDYDYDESSLMTTSNPQKKTPDIHVAFIHDLVQEREKE